MCWVPPALRSRQAKYLQHRASASEYKGKRGGTPRAGGIRQTCILRSHPLALPPPGPPKSASRLPPSSSQAFGNPTPRKRREEKYLFPPPPRYVGEWAHPNLSTQRWRSCAPIRTSPSEGRRALVEGEINSQIIDPQGSFDPRAGRQAFSSPPRHSPNQCLRERAKGPRRLCPSPWLPGGVLPGGGRQVDLSSFTIGSTPFGHWPPGLTFLAAANAQPDSSATCAQGRDAFLVCKTDRACCRGQEAALLTG